MLRLPIDGPGACKSGCPGLGNGRDVDDGSALGPFVGQFRPFTPTPTTTNSYLHRSLRASPISRRKQPSPPVITCERNLPGRTENQVAEDVIENTDLDPTMPDISSAPALALTVAVAANG